MKTLEKQFTARGWHFTQLARVSNAALYAKRKAEWPSDKFNYEVIRVSYNKATTATFGGVRVDYPERETYPSDHQWGQKGWTYSDEDMARAKFRSLAATQTRKEAFTGDREGVFKGGGIPEHRLAHQNASESDIEQETK
jgi:hypothetical protein